MKSGHLARTRRLEFSTFCGWGRHGEQGPFDISKILTADPTAIQNPASELWGPLYAPHHWGESLFGYYVSDDDSVLRKHSQMLSDAGIDMVVFDVTNQFTYPESWRALCRVWDESRRAGNRVPQIAFLCPFGNPSKVVQELWDQLYGRSLYEELWFRWEGKPLILADPSWIPYGLTHEQRDVPAELKSRATLGQSFSGNGAVCFCWWVVSNLGHNGCGSDAFSLSQWSEW